MAKAQHGWFILATKITAFVDGRDSYGSMFVIFGRLGVHDGRWAPWSALMVVSLRIFAAE